MTRMGNTSRLTRRDFIKLASLGLGAVALPVHKLASAWAGPAWPSLALEQLPARVQLILSLAPYTQVSEEGYLHQAASDGTMLGPVTQAYTQWNKERRHPYDRMRTNVPWAIVLHWYGDNEQFDRSLAGYLRGFDSLRKIDEHETRTSAHFLVGPGRTRRLSPKDELSGIVQTQKPAPDGVPFLASHLQPIDLVAHAGRRQYFVRALYQLSWAEPAVHSLLQDFYDGRYMDQNFRTLAIEISGFDFENLEHFPSAQQIANVVSLVWALMKRYNVQASNLLGHMEVQLNKADPGKKFMALMRHLIGIKALVEDDEQMKDLVFGQFMGSEGDTGLAVHRYFKFVRDYLVLTGVPRSVYEWESAGNFWLCQQLLAPTASMALLASAHCNPLESTPISAGSRFLEPEYHEGLDLYQDGYSTQAFTSAGQPVRLVAPGTCLYIGEAGSHCRGGTAIFQHFLPSGSQTISVYGHLGQLGDLTVGQVYPMEYRVGETVGNVAQGGRYMHFATAYGATWDMHLSRSATLPLNIGKKWILERYLSPLDFLA